ncbi:MAG: hypothetical protein WC365_06240 [Candidatus Babeliales bacterium]
MKECLNVEHPCELRRKTLIEEMLTDISIIRYIDECTNIEDKCIHEEST